MVDNETQTKNVIMISGFPERNETTKRQQEISPTIIGITDGT